MGKKNSKTRFTPQLGHDDIVVLMDALRSSFTDVPVDFAADPQHWDFDRLDLTLSREYGETAVRITVRSEPKKSRGKKSYRKLKARIEDSYRKLKQATRRRVLPPADQLRQFLVLGKTMRTYPDKGEEFYDAFADACNGVEQACADGDLDAFRRAMKAVERIKKDAHERYR